MNCAADVLRACWQDTAAHRPGHTPSIEDAAALDDLLRRHGEPHRRYHTADHVAAVLGHVDDLLRHSSGVTIDAGVVRVAALFHDVIYDPSSATNETDSAQFAVSVLLPLGWTPSRLARVAQLIEATAGHLQPVPDPASADTDITDTGGETGSDTVSETDILLDADLAILGAGPDTYATYVRDVRFEYSHVDEDQWRAGRGTVLRTLLDRPLIYRTARMRAAREAQARRNLGAELAALAKG